MCVIGWECITQARDHGFRILPHPELEAIDSLALGMAANMAIRLWIQSVIYFFGEKSFTCFESVPFPPCPIPEIDGESRTERADLENI